MPDKRLRPHQILICSLTAALSLVLDQLTKLWITNLEKSGVLPLGTGFFQITYGENTGAAFGSFQNGWLYLSIISIIGILVLLFIEVFLSQRYSFIRWKTSQLALGLILGGTIGNLIGRLSVHYVVDFIKMGAWPDYNIADSSVVVGGILLAFNLIRSATAERSDEKATSADGK
jgi:signal peptidase II